MLRTSAWDGWSGAPGRPHLPSDVPATRSIRPGRPWIGRSLSTGARAEHAGMTSAHHLYALPEHRRLDLKARFPRLTEQQISDQLGRTLQLRGAACARSDKRRGHLPAVAILGSDERWHLRLGTAMICSNAARMFIDLDVPAPTPGTVIPHSFRTRFPNGSVGLERPGYRPDWDVVLTGQEQRPDLVPRAERCPINLDQGDWAPCSVVSRSDWKGRKRNLYIAAAGPMCHACGDSLGQDLHYDRYTELITGLLCNECSSHINECPHPAGCYQADYLNAPPAAHLKERYYVGGNRDDRKRAVGSPAA
uniref:Endonuclease n=2 Tax=Streptomyces TaxID=1883 RepID=V9Z8X6_9ACTN|nr:Endonuclease [Streptomyces sp. F12]